VTGGVKEPNSRPKGHGFQSFEDIGSEVSSHTQVRTERGTIQWSQFRH